MTAAEKISELYGVEVRGGMKPGHDSNLATPARLQLTSVSSCDSNMQLKMVADCYHYSMKLFTFSPGILWYGTDGRVSRLFSGSKYSVHSLSGDW